MRSIILCMVLGLTSCGQRSAADIAQAYRLPASTIAQAGSGAGSRERMNDGTYLLARETMRGGQLVACGGATGAEMEAAKSSLRKRWMDRGMTLSEIDATIRRGLDTATTAEPL